MSKKKARQVRFSINVEKLDKGIEILGHIPCQVNNVFCAQNLPFALVVLYRFLKALLSKFPKDPKLSNNQTTFGTFLLRFSQFHCRFLIAKSQYVSGKVNILFEFLFCAKCST